MIKSINPSRRIHILREDVARKIAAGEVIDRPFSVVRELLDNALDAESSELTLYLENGGIDLIRLVDNGLGMDAEDLKLCYLPHATSKIIEEGDLYRTTTLGFRGEALSSIAGCAKLDITSCPAESPHGHKLVVRGGKMISLEKHRGKTGTVVEVAELFYNMPARKKFLKRASGETTTCKTVFLDKALAHPGVSFRFFVNGKLGLFLPEASFPERVTAAFSGLPREVLFEEEVVYDDFSIHIVGGKPEVNRGDRKQIQIFVNGRRVSEYALVQAVQYGYAEYMPGKDFPVAFVFISIKPELVDFNIHPAKKECRFLNLQTIHRSLVALIKACLNKFSITVDKPGSAGVVLPVQQKSLDFTYSFPRKERSGSSYSVHEPGASRASLDSKPPDTGVPVSGTPLPTEPLAPRPAEESERFRYLGQVFGLFLAVEREDRFFLVDQHAAHEKILYNRLCETPPAMQELIFPLSFETEAEEEKLLEPMLPELKQWGIGVTKSGSGLFEITALSTSFQGLPSEELIAFLKNQRGSARELQQKLFSMAACRSAIKDGDLLDHLTAVKLLKEAFELKNARCPHGRPIWHVISREELFRFTGRK